MSKSILSLSAALIGLSAFAGTSQAIVTVYTTQASYLAAIGAPGVDTFEDVSITGSTASPITRSAGAFGYTAAVSTTSFFGAGSSGDHWLSTNTATDTVTFDTFTGGVQGFGGFFFGSDISGLFSAGDITLVATDASGSTPFTIIGATTSSFVGFVSDGALTSVTLASVQPSASFLWPTANDVTLGAAVPAPGAAALLGLGGLVARRRRR
jgi:MYXO-CTERM domain-containing protein